MIKKQSKKELQKSRVRRIRAKVSGTHARPRFTVYKTNYALYGQFIDDTKSITLLSHKVQGKNIAAAVELGKEISKRAKAQKINSAVFDRRGYRYHGAVKALADTLREGGIHI